MLCAMHPAEQLLDFDDIIGVLVTHMDLEDLEWDEDDLTSCLSTELGMGEAVVFSGIDTSGAELQADILRCA